MVTTRTGSKRETKKKNKTTPTDVEGASNIQSTSAAATRQNNNDNEIDECEKQLENLKLIASLVDWSSYDRLMGKIFYEKFGKMLEKKYDELEQTKKDLKEYVRKTCEDTKALKTPPRHAKPAVALLEQINQLKKLDFDMTDEESMDQSAAVIDGNQQQPTVALTEEESDQTTLREEIVKTPSDQTANDKHVPETPQQPELTFTVQPDVPPEHEHQQTPVPDYVMDTPEAQTRTNQNKMPPAIPVGKAKRTIVKESPKVPVATTPPTPVTPLPKKPKVAATPVSAVQGSLKKLAITQAMKNAQPVRMPPILNLASSPRAPLNTTYQKKQKLKEIDEKVVKAEKMKNEQIKERAERAKKEREERQKRVELNNRQKEQQRIEKLERVRQHEAAVKEYQEQQKNLAKAAAQRTPRTPQQPLEKETAQRTPQLPKQPPIKKERPKNCQEGKRVPNKAKTDKENEPPQVAKQEPMVGKKPQKQQQCHQNEKPPTPQLSPILPDESSEMEVEDGEVSVYDITKEKVFLPSTKDNYNVDDLSSGDETDNDSNPRKIVPKWAQKENMVQRIEAIRRLLTTERIERHFGQVRQPTVEQFFGGYKKKYPQRRASSAVWDSPMSDPTPGIARFPLN